MKSKIILISSILALCILCIAMLTGCGNNKKTTDTPTETQAAQISETAAVTEAATEAEAKQTATQTQAETTASAENSPLIGSWEYEEMSGFTYTFNPDGTGTYDVMGEVMSFTYTDNGDSIEMLYEDVDAPSTYAYSIDGNTLTIKDSFGSDVKYIKK